MDEFYKPHTKNEEGLPVRLILCLDGTGDTAKGSFSAIEGATTGTKDSIKSIFDMIKAGPVEDASGNRFFQYAQYFEGIGTDGAGQNAGLFVRVGALFDGATGFGYLDILQNSYKVCCEKLQGGEKNEIFLFGFSRGAFMVRALASFLQNVGLIKPEELGQGDDAEKTFEKKFYELLRRYSELTKKSIFFTQTHASKDLLPFCTPSPRVRLVGAFDTVKTVIPLPVHNLLSHGVPNIDFEMDAPGIVDHFRHALALNEARPLFNPDLWKSPANSADSSYLEAWFFGYHHDIGGGDDNQGLALWPLQWILHAATDYGLVLDSTVPPYSILFSGADNVIVTPHEVVMKMFDMIKHHGPTENFGLRLHQPFSLMLPQPRNYFEYLTTPPYLNFFKPKVFLHPAAYLVFDISSSFRIQVYEWKYFRNFMRDRPIALDKAAPWWEQQTVECILNEGEAVEHLNLLVCGPPGTGKLSLINRMFGEAFTWGSGSKAPLTEGTTMAHDVSTPLSIPGNDQARIYFSGGVGTRGSDNLASLKKLLAEQKEKASLEDKIHAVWYFVDCTGDEIEASEKKFFDLDFGDIPVLAVLENEDKLRDSFLKPMTGDELPDQQTIERLFNEAMEKKINEIKDLPARSYVHARNSLDTPKNLLTETSLNFKNESVQIAQIKAQRISVKPKIALATEESIRAYVIWHTFKFGGKEIAFKRNKDDGKHKLTWMLMEPVLATFNMRFSGDNALIHSLIGNAWSSLDNHKSGLLDKSIPGDLILMCMVDTVIVLTHALSHQQISGKLKLVTDYARPLSAPDIEAACAWYTSATKNRQAATHARIRSNLNEEDWSPKDKSIAHLQMKIIETVELESDNAEKATVSGLIGGVIGALGGKQNSGQSSFVGSLTKGFF